MSDSEITQTVLRPGPEAVGDRARVDGTAPSLQWCARPDRGVIGMVGGDRVTFLQGMCSNDIKALAPGAIAYVLFLTEHAHVVGDAYVWAGEDALYLDVDRALWPRIREHLEKFLVADDVEFEDHDDLAIADIVGADAPAAVAKLIAASAPALWHFAGRGRAKLANLPRAAAPAATLIAPADDIGALRGQLGAARPELTEIGPDALQIYRVEAGYAEIGRDTGDKTLAMEARLERGISFKKGCYIGQETVERATARGGVRKRLFGLRIEGAMPAPGAIISAAGRPVGELTSVVDSPRFGVIGLAVLHHSAWQPGLEVTVTGAGGEQAATVSDLPFA